jgi:hypothetical protein
MKLIVLASCLIGIAAVDRSTAESGREMAPSGAVTWLAAPVFAPEADCDGEGICHNPNASCKALDDEYCNSSLPDPINGGCKDPDMAGRDSKSDPNGDCCWCLYDS